MNDWNKIRARSPRKARSSHYFCLKCPNSNLFVEYLDVDLKDVLLSGFPEVSCVEGLVRKDIPARPGVCRVSGALFMVRAGGGGSFTMTWTRRDTAIGSRRSDAKVNLEEDACKPLLVLYDVERNNWEIFAYNLPASEPCYWGSENLVYVGGNILFIIDQASCWVVYDMSAKKKVGKVDVRVEDWDVIMKALYLGSNDMISSSWIFYIFKPNYVKNYCYRNFRYAKVEVIQVQGGDYISTVHFSGILKIGGFDDLYIIADEASIKRTAEENRLKERERRMRSE
ncbi:hypothetical protein SASPL_150075 [Salvia splendens]|uniref:F-box associated domain-containing protein n=1 Tax=Salvia splendens TaxID=180675 RepID=A0A8X8W5K1_SALSN|nr:hypothetical protein SASPL_150075 [Salvia splendens]